MKILAIKGKNLASFAEAFCIDFRAEPLASAGLFAITGKTGAGKSTILDALTLSLYARVSRLVNAGKSKEGADGLTSEDPRRVLRNGTTEGYAEVVFEASRGGIYRSRWAVHRAGMRNSGKISPYQMSLVNEENNSDFSGTNTEILKEIERLIGLDFEQFRRTILLAQGDFATFLKADASKKTELLECVTGTNIYRDISIKVFQKNKEAQESISLLSSQIDSIKTLSKEEITAIVKGIECIQTEVLSKENLLKTTDRQLAWLKEYTKKKELLEAGEKALQIATNEYQKSESRRAELAEVEAVQVIKPTWLAREKDNEEIQQAKDTLVALTKLLKDKQLFWDANKQELIKIAEEKEKLSKTIEDLTPTLKEVRSIDDEIRNTDESISQLKKAVDKNSQVQLLNKQKVLSQLKEDLEALKKEEYRLQHTLSLEILRLRAQLIDGEPCPVCGAIHHHIVSQNSLYNEEDKMALDEESLRDKESLISEDIKKCEGKILSINETIGGLKLAVETEKKQAKDLRELMTHRKRLIEKRERLMGDKDGDEVEKSLKESLKNQTEKWLSTNEYCHSIEKEIGGIDAKIDIITTTITTKKGLVQQYNSEVADFISNYPTTITEKYLAQLLSHTLEWINAERKHQSELVDTLKTSRNTYEERLRLYNEHNSADEKPAKEVTLNELKRVSDECQAELKSLRKKEQELNIQIARNKDERKRKGELQKSVDALKPIATQWEKLNDLIGSAKGDKFAKIAQQYTIANLLRYANQQLNIIAPRYQLKQVDPDSLNLVVVDRDMLNEERSVFSLSGGETFLVSLALALGLSSLSSQQVSIGSLFIDEGFGSLDSETLGIALDSLEQLQSQQNRIVGVISHVQEMNDRIGVQIHVDGNGTKGSHLSITS